MDIKSSFYLPIKVGNPDYSKHISSCNLFFNSNEVIRSTTNKYAESIIELINLTYDTNINYDTLLGWEAAKILVPKVCVDYNYIVKILFVGQSLDFIHGFESYRLSNDNYRRFQIDYNVITIGKKIKSNEYNVIGHFPSFYTYVEAKIVNYRDLYDGIVSNDFYASKVLHLKGHYLNIVRREMFDVVCMYMSCIFTESLIVDVPILSDVFILSKLVRNSAHLDRKIIKKYPKSITSDIGENFYKFYDALDMGAITNTLNNRKLQLAKVDYQSIWFSLNPEFARQFELDLWDISNGGESLVNDDNDQDDKKY
jgi:hypothetical protein